MDTVAFWVGTVLVPLFGVAISIYVARIYGDRAGTQAAIEYEKEKAKEARIVALQALLNEVTLAKGISLQSVEIQPSRDRIVPLLKLPVAGFEMALLSTGSSLLNPDEEPHGLSERLLNAVEEYLRVAHGVNTTIEYYLEAVSGLGSQHDTLRANVVSHVKSASHVAFEKTTHLESVLKEELARAKADIEGDRQI